MKLSQCRLRVVNYLDDLVNDVDLRVEQALAQGHLNELDIERVNQRREEIITRIRQVQDHNLAHLGNTYKEEECDGLTETEIDRRLFLKFCFLFDASKTIDYHCSVDQLFGHFVIVDRFIRRETLAAFRELMQGHLSVNNLLFQMEKKGGMFINIKTSDVFRADNLMMECTAEELFRLDLVYVNGEIINSINEPARELFENIQRVDYTVKSFSQESIESVRLIARNADHVDISSYYDKFDASMIAGLSDIKIKSLHLSVKVLFKLTHDADGSTVAEPFQLADLLLHLPHLEELYLDSSKKPNMTAEQHTTIKFKRLKKLTLKSLDLDVEFIECFENLNELVIEGVPKTAEAIKKNLKLMQHLQSVEIKACSLHEIEPESFQGLQSITSLKFEHSCINKIHENGFIHLNNLTRLDLCNNNLEKLDASALNGLTSLTYLNLSSCHITKLDENMFTNLRSLTSLNLSGNKLTTICKSISGLSQLKQLYLQNNSIEILDGGVFEHLVELETLHLSYNSIKSVERNVFQSLTKLQKLYLNGNQISSIEAETFQGLSALTLLVK